MIVVIAIIAILIALLVPSIIGFIRDSKETSGLANAKNAFVAAQTFAAKQIAAGSAVTAADMTEANLSDYLNTNTSDFINLSFVVAADGVVTSTTYTDPSSGTAYTYPDNVAVTPAP